MAAVQHFCNHFGSATHGVGADEPHGNASSKYRRSSRALLHNQEACSRIVCDPGSQIIVQRQDTPSVPAFFIRSVNDAKRIAFRIVIDETDAGLAAKGKLDGSKDKLSEVRFGHGGDTRGRRGIRSGPYP
jgi:hypothetical protein